MTGETVLVAGEVVEVDGQALDGATLDKVTRLRVAHALCRTSTVELTIDEEAAGSRFSLGGDLAVKLRARYASADVATFTGMITSIGVEVVRGRSEITVVAHDKSVGFGRKSTFDSVLGSRVSDVISSLASAHGLTPTVTVTGDATIEHLFTVGTDLDLLEWLTAAYGCVWWVGGVELHVAAPTLTSAVATLTNGVDLREFRARFGGVDSAKSIELRRWDPVSKAVQSGSYTPTSGDVPSNASIVGQMFSGGVDLAGGNPAVASVNSLPADVAVADLAGGLGRRMASSMMVAAGECDLNPAIEVGSTLALEDIGTLFNGDYLLSEVRHERSGPDSFVTRFVCGEPTRTPLAAADTQGSWGKVTDNVAVGVVTNIEDPDGKNRVKVKIPVISDDIESNWARVVQTGAGKGRGLFVLPEVGDEVLVAFENGNLQSPYVIGGLWNGTDASPQLTQITNGKVMHRSLVSRKGHRLVMHDGDQSATNYVEVLLADDRTTLTVGQEEIVILSNAKPIRIEDKKSKIELDGNGAVKITGTSITIEAEQALTLKSKQAAVTVQSGTALDVKAGTKLTAQGSAGAELNGGPTTDVKGGMVNIN